MNRRARVFAISPRTQDVNRYWEDIRSVAALADEHGFTGVLLFAGNDTYLEPWIVAQNILSMTRSISPLIAVNPIYMHPFTAAKMTASLARLYGRKIYLNMITGTALSYQEAMGDHISHDDRYVRLGEYVLIVKQLLSSARPISFDGKYYQVRNLQVYPGLPVDLAPEFFLAGQSDAARRICATTDSIGMQMLPGQLKDGVLDAPSIHFGIVTRESDDRAWEAAHALFPVNIENQKILEYSMSNTDAIWKRRMKAASEQETASETGYWLAPFANFQADCPYLVGSHKHVAEVLRRLVRGGASSFIFDIPANAEDFWHVARALELSGI
jgi:alkanesulfonate monooxygenase